MLLPETLKLHNHTLFEFHYIYFLPWKDQMVKYIQSAGGKVSCFEAKNNIELLTQSGRVISYCKKNDIELIHCHLPWSGFLGRKIFFKTRIPVIYTEHNIQERYHFVTKLLNKLSYNQQTLAIGVSEDVSASISKNINPKIPVKTILNGVNTQFFRKNPEKGLEVKKKYDIPLNSVVIGNIAVFREQKCIPEWIQAFKKISQEHVDVYGLLVGAGPEEKKIQDLIKEEGLEGKIVLPGLQEDTVSFFSAMDIFMMSSEFEGLPVALLEAMSMECAIVSTRAGGVVEAVRDGHDGLLCQVGDWKELALLAGRLVNDQEQRSSYQTAARKRVKDSFSLSKMVQNLEEIYLEQIAATVSFN